MNVKVSKVDIVLVLFGMKSAQKINAIVLLVLSAFSLIFGNFNWTLLVIGLLCIFSYYFIVWGNDELVNRIYEVLVK